MKAYLVNLAKLAISLALIAYLVHTLLGEDEFDTLWRADKNWLQLAAAWALCLIAVGITIARWFLLVRTLGLPFGFRDALRLGSMGYALNMVSLGSVGGDLFKAVAVAREHRDRKTKAVASVIVDRCVGMYGLFLLASLGVALLGGQEEGRIDWLCRLPWLGAIAGTLAIGAMSLPVFATSPLAEFLGGLPRLGPMCRQVFSAFYLYRKNWPLMLGTVGMGMLVHLLFSVAFWLLALGLFGKAPSLWVHLVIVPLGMTAGAIPLPMGALGAMDLAFSMLYARIPEASPLTAAEGLLVAFGYRAVTLTLAVLATITWFVHPAGARRAPGIIVDPNGPTYTDASVAMTQTDHREA